MDVARFVDLSLCQRLLSHFPLVIQSSTVNLLGRLFDATKGEIFVDDIPIRKFKAEDLRLAQAILYQDFVKYPTSVR